MWLLTTTSEITQEQIDDLRKDSHVLYVFGRITYENVFRHSHLTTFCVWFEPDLSTPEHCHSYNDAD